MDDVLKSQPRPYGLRDVEGRPGIAWPCSGVQKQRPIGPEHPGGCGDPRIGPLEVLSRRQGVLIPVVTDAKVVRRRRDDDVDALGRKLIENLDAVAPASAQGYDALVASGSETAGTKRSAATVWLRRCP